MTKEELYRVFETVAVEMHSSTVYAQQDDIFLMVDIVDHEAWDRRWQEIRNDKK